MGFAWAKSATVENALSGFRATGIIPLNRFSIPDYAYLTDSNGSQVEDAVSPQMLTTDTAIPGTSSGITHQEVITPTKLLNEISPVPVIKKQISARGKAASVSKILNSDDNIGQRVEKSCSVKKETFHKPKRARKMKMESSDSSEDEDAAVYQESDDSTTWNDDECVGCGEDYNDTTSKADWLRCISCSRWFHEDCSSYPNKCQQCGKCKTHFK